MSKALIICVLEDDEAAILLIREGLQSVAPDCTIKMAENGYEVLRLLAKLPPPDLVVLDIMTPLMGGFDVLRRIRSYPEVDWLPVVMFSTDGSDSNRDKAKELGANGFYEKPMAEKMPEILAEIIGKFSFNGSKPDSMPMFLHDSLPAVKAKPRTIDEIMDGWL